MIVTEIAELSKTKCKVYIDDEFAFALYKGELQKYHIRKGGELPEETYQLITKEVLLKRAKLRCMNLLKSRDYTKYQLMSKLKQSMYPSDIIEQALEYVISYGYVEDERYARSYIESSGRFKSRRQIETDLMKKGIDKESIRQIFQETLETQQLPDEEKLIHALLEKKHYCRDTASREENKKIIGFLYRKGFSLDKIYKTLDCYVENTVSL